MRAPGHTVLAVAVVAIAAVVINVAVAARDVASMRDAASRTLPIRAESRAVERSSVGAIAAAARMRAAAARVRSLRADTWACQDALGIARTRAAGSGWALPPSLRYRSWVADRWRDRAASCERERAARTLPATGDWMTAVRVVQRVYPGTADWLTYISDREGGHGPWVWYGGRPWAGYHIGNDYLGADTVGGWMQFRYSTFEPNWRMAQADLARRGIIVPPFPDRGGDPRYRAWLDPLGQALTAGFMRYTGRDGCHWCLG